MAYPIHRVKAQMSEDKITVTVFLDPKNPNLWGSYHWQEADYSQTLWATGYPLLVLPEDYGT
jgi:hypothetical protein